jgi:hypothetical protein
MEQSPSRPEIEERLVEARKERASSILRITRLTGLPVAVWGGISIAGGLAGLCFSENPDLNSFVAFSFAYVTGGIAGAFSPVYFFKFANLMDEYRYASARVRNYKTQLQEVR